MIKISFILLQILTQPIHTEKNALEANISDNAKN
jgi:hypothetical protein